MATEELISESGKESSRKEGGGGGETEKHRHSVLLLAKGLNIIRSSLVPL